MNSPARPSGRSSRIGRSGDCTADRHRLLPAPWRLPRSRLAAFGVAHPRRRLARPACGMGRCPGRGSGAAGDAADAAGIAARWHGDGGIARRQRVRRTPRNKSYAIPAAEILGFEFLLNQFDRHVLGTDFASNASTIRRNLHSSWVVDRDPFEINQLGHPYAGLDVPGVRAFARVSITGNRSATRSPAARYGRSPASAACRRATTRSTPASAAASSAKSCFGCRTSRSSTRTCRRSGAKRPPR